MSEEDPRALGQRLRAERERRGMSTKKVANGMRLDEWVIDALEAGDHQRIGPAVYAKGHLKKYASLLGISPDPPGTDAVPAASPSGGAYPPPIVRLDKPRESHAAWPRIGTAAAVALLAGGVYWWREAHHGAAAHVAAAPPRSRTDVSAAPAAPGAAGAPAVDARAGAVSPVTEAASIPAVLPAPSAAPTAPGAAGAAGDAERTPGVGKARLRLSFSADSWVDIRDYSGKRVFEGNGAANSVKTVAGLAPFRVYLRSAGGVQLQLNDRAVAIGRQFISGDEARFEAGADGVLRRDVRPAPDNGAQTAAVSPHG